MSPKKMGIEEYITILDGKLDKKLDLLKEDLKRDMIAELHEIVHKQNDKIDVLENSVCMLQQQIESLKEVNIVNSRKQDDIEQYGRRRLCLRIQGIEEQDSETAEDVFSKVEEIIESECVIPSNVIDRAHRIGSKPEGKNGKSVIVRFTTFRHRTLLYRARKRLNVKISLDLTTSRYILWRKAIDLIESKENVKFVYALYRARKRLNVKISLDLTTSRYILWRKAIDLIESKENVKFVYAHINCRLEVRFENDTEQFFSTISELERIISI